MSENLRARIAGLAVSACAASALAQGGQVVVPIVSPPSSLSAELCLSGQCDDDTSPVTGTMTVELDSFSNPTQIRIVSYSLVATESLDFRISAGFLGSFTATASTLSLSDAGGVSPFGPLAGGNFTIPTLEASATGNLSYNASGIYCIALQGAMLECSSAIDLAALGTQSAPNVTGTATIANDELSLSFSVSVTTPFDPTNPSLGGVTVSALASGTAPLPDICIPDISGPTTPGIPDGVLSGADFFEYLARFQAGDLRADISSPTNPSQPDGLLSGADFFEYLTLFAAGC